MARAGFLLVSYRPLAHPGLPSVFWIYATLRPSARPSYHQTHLVCCARGALLQSLRETAPHSK